MKKQISLSLIILVAQTAHAQLIEDQLMQANQICPAIGVWTGELFRKEPNFGEKANQKRLEMLFDIAKPISTTRSPDGETPYIQFGLAIHFVEKNYTYWPVVNLARVSSMAVGYCYDLHLNPPNITYP